MQAGRLNERVEIYRGINKLEGIAGGVRRKAKPIAVAMANVKVESGGYVDDLGGYVASQEVTFELHYHLRSKLIVGGVVKRADRVISIQREEGGNGEAIYYELYEITSVQPSRPLNRVYVKGHLLKTAKEGIGL